MLQNTMVPIGFFTLSKGAGDIFHWESDFAAEHSSTTGLTMLKVIDVSSFPCF